jgi:hypothetical protein
LGFDYVGCFEEVHACFMYTLLSHLVWCFFWILTSWVCFQEVHAPCILVCLVFLESHRCSSHRWCDAIRIEKENYSTHVVDRFSWVERRHNILTWKWKFSMQATPFVVVTSDTIAPKVCTHDMPCHDSPSEHISYAHGILFKSIPGDPAWHKGPFSTRSQGQKYLGPILSNFFGLQIGPEGLQIGLPNLMVSLLFFWPWGQYKAIMFGIFLLTRGKLKNFFLCLALTPSVKAFGPISTFAPIGMLVLGWTLALTPPSVKQN